MRRIRFLFSVPLLLVINTSAHSQSHNPRQQYDAYLASLRSALMSSDAIAVGNLVTDDRVTVSGANGRTMRGRAAQVESDKAFFRTSRVTSFEVRVTDFRGSDSLAYATGVGTHDVLDLATGQKRTDRSQFVEVLVLEADGHWRSRYFMNAPVELGK